MIKVSCVQCSESIIESESMTIEVVAALKFSQIGGRQSEGLLGACKYGVFKSAKQEDVFSTD